ncbi:putative quinol monooxygenase [Catellatospora citrea]|nr:antibiotic biosynthesis monooxygenase [Catellatospora citrea]RKE07927.1 antibiotic biosynthesis monooxygenase [Catellatospora citrea]
MSSSNPIDVVFRFRVKPGKQEQYQKAIDYILPITEAKEPYVLEYNIYNNIEGVFTQHERYADEAALHRHMELTAQGQQDWAEAIELEDVVVLGEMSDKFWSLYGGPHAHGFQEFRRVAR